MRTDLPRDYLDAERVYRELRRGLENRKHYQEAARFVSREFDMRRQAKAARVTNSVARWLRRQVWSVEAWYHHLSDYGDSIGRPLAILCLSLILVVPLLLALSGAATIDGANYTLLPPRDQESRFGYWDLLLLSLRWAALLPDLDRVRLTPWGQFLQVLVRIAAPFVALLLSLAIRRRFRR